jgi:hypothetical protein
VPTAAASDRRAVRSPSARTSPVRATSIRGRTIAAPLLTVRNETSSIVTDSAATNSSPPPPASAAPARLTAMREARSGSVAAVGTVCLLGVVDGVQAWTHGLKAEFLIGSVGYATVLGAAALGATRTPPSSVTRWPRPPVWAWAAAVGAFTGGVLLVVGTGLALEAAQTLWYDSSQSSPELYRRPYDGTLYAAVTIIAAAPLILLAGRVASSALGVVAGAAALFAAAAGAVLGAGFAPDDDSRAVWAGSLAVAALILFAVVLAAARSGARRALRRPRPIPAVLAGTGTALLLAGHLVAIEGGSPAVSYGLALLLLTLPPAVAAAGSLTLADATARRFAVGATLTYVLLMAIAAVYPIAANTARTYFGWLLAGHLVVAAAVAVDLVVRRRRSAEPSPSTPRLLSS